MAIILFVLEIQIQSLQARVLINNIEVFVSDTGAPRTLQTKINHWLVKGNNRVQVILAPLPEEEAEEQRGEAAEQEQQEQETGSGREMFKLQIVRGIHGTEPGPDNGIARFEWNADENPLNPEERTKVFSQEFVVSDNIGPWAWETAQRIQSGEKEKTEIRYFVDELHRAFAAKRNDIIMRRLALKNEEMAVALGVPVERIMTGQRTHLDSYFRDPEWAMEPLKMEEIDIRSQADGRIFIIKGPNGEPPLKGSSGERSFAFEMAISNIDDQWIIIR